VRLKAVQAVLPIHKAQLLSYMKLVNAPRGLLINFHELSLRDSLNNPVEGRQELVTNLGLSQISWLPIGG
jgi:PD-(D/E)XK nuclease superfamily